MSTVTIADTIPEALADGIRANHSDADVKALEPRITYEVEGKETVAGRAATKS